jgi:hypothetical protein
MPIIDDDGALFGLVNVVDALALLLVLAVLVAGGAFVLLPDDEPAPPATDTVNATLDLGTQPDYLVDALNEGDSYAPDGTSELTITDVYTAPQDGQTRVLLKVQLAGLAEGESISYADGPPRLSRELAIQTETYATAGRIRTLGGGDQLETERRDVVLQTTLPAARAESLGSGQEIRVADRTVGTIGDVAVYDTGSPDQKLVFVHAELETYVDGDTARFGTTALRPGVTLQLPTTQAPIDATVQSVGANLSTTSTDVLVTTTLPTTEAADVDVGDAYRVDGRDVATVESLAVYGTNDPDQKRLYVGLSLETVAMGELPRFGETSVREGVTVPFQTPEYSFDGKVQRVGTTEQRGTQTTKTVTLKMRDVPPEVANAVSAGMSETTADQTVATVTGVTREDSTVVLRSDDGNIYERPHPVNDDLTLTVDLQVRETATGVTFKGRTLQQGSTVTLDLGSITIEATVTSL